MLMQEQDVAEGEVGRLCMVFARFFFNAYKLF